MIFIKINLGFFHGIIHPVMNIKTRKILITHPTSPHIRFVSQNQGRTNLRHDRLRPRMIYRL